MTDDEMREQAEWLLAHWTAPAFVRPAIQEKALAVARTVPGLVARLRETHEAQCGCDRPGNPVCCVAQPPDAFVGVQPWPEAELLGADTVK